MSRAVLAFVAAIPCVILLLPVFAVTMAAASFAAAVRAVGRLLEPRFMPWTELIAFDRHLGWKPRPNLNTHYLAARDDVFRVVTDQDGWPGRRRIDDSQVVVIGDSFAFGYGVDTERSFAEVDPRLQVKAVGAPGYSMVHGVLLMEQLEARLAGKLVVWFVYMENDLQDNLSPAMMTYRAPFVRRDVRGRWEIVDHHVSPASWRSSALEKRRLFPQLCVPGAIADRAYDACDYLIERAQSTCARIGARLVILTIPHPMQLTSDGAARLGAQSGAPDACDVDLPDRRIAACCQRHGVPMVAGKAHLSAADYKSREGIHWNERGHRRVAKVLASLTEAFRSGVLDATPAPGMAPRPQAAGLPVQVQQAPAHRF